MRYVGLLRSCASRPELTASIEKKVKSIVSGAVDRLKDAAGPAVDG